MVWSSIAGNEENRIVERRERGGWTSGASADAQCVTENIELFVNEMLRRKNILTGGSRKRKASVSRWHFSLFLN